MKLILSIVLLIVLTGCTKFGKNISISGRIYNPVTNEGIKGISIRMFKSKNDPGELLGNSSGVKFVAEATTDENGHYTIEHLGGTKDYFIQVNPLDYYPVGWSDTKVHDNKRVKKGKAMVADFELLPYAYIKQSIHNVNCSGTTDTMVYQRNNCKASLYGLNSINFTGCYDYDAQDYFQYPMGWVSYKIKVTKNGVDSVILDSIYVDAGEYANHSINY